MTKSDNVSNGNLGSTPPATSVEAASAQAPFIFADGVPTWAGINGTIYATLSAMRIHNRPNGPPATDHPIVAHLRLSVPAARALVAALTAALDLDAKNKVPPTEAIIDGGTIN